MESTAAALLARNDIKPSVMNSDTVPRQEIEAMFKTYKDDFEGAFLKIYDDGGIKTIDKYGVMAFYENFEEFRRFCERNRRKKRA